MTNRIQNKRVNRKQFLKNAGLTMGAAWLGSSAIACQTVAGAGTAGSLKKNGKPGERILVLGAGMAGVAAANRLQAEGYDVLVVEGRRRLGGRIYTDRPETHGLGTDLDLGAAWIHGHIRNPIAHLSRKIGQRLLYTDFDNAELKYPDGSPVSEQLTEILEERSAGVFLNMMNRLRTVKKDISVAEAIRLALKENNIKPDPFWDWSIHTSLGDDFATSPENLSIQALDEGEGFEGGDYFPEGGYIKIINYLARGLQIKRGVIVTGVSQNAQGVTLETNQGPIEGDRLICTLPLGVLKAGLVSFDPPLPAAKQRAIKRLGMGSLNKIALRFPRCFWPEKLDVLGRVIIDEAPPIFLNMYRFTGVPLVVGYTGGGKVPDPNRKNRELIAAAGQAFTKLFKKNAEPVAGVVTRWNEDPFACGSYSYLPVGVSTRERLALGKPVGGRLFFAGEATSPDHASTVHGAYLSGIREAENILALAD